MAKDKAKSGGEVLKERDETAVVAATRFSTEQTVKLLRDHRTEVIVYGPPYQAGARYDVVAKWPGHQRLTFRNIGDGDVSVSDFDPVDRTPTGNVDQVYISVSKHGVANPELQGSATPIGGDKHLVWFYDFEIGRDNVVTVFMVSYAD
jgi:hypothetical protein